MRYLFAFEFFLTPLGFLASQNAFLYLFHVQYQELTPLITDSLYIRVQSAAGGETTCAIGYRHREDLPSSWHDVRTQEMPLGLWRISQQTEQGAYGQITYIYFVDSLSSDTLQNRLTTFSIQPDRPDSILSEIWENGKWEPVQKSIFMLVKCLDSALNLVGTIQVVCGKMYPLRFTNTMVNKG